MPHNCFVQNCLQVLRNRNWNAVRVHRKIPSKLNIQNLFSFRSLKFAPTLLSVASRPTGRHFSSFARSPRFNRLRVMAALSNRSSFRNKIFGLSVLQGTSEAICVVLTLQLWDSSLDLCQVVHVGAMHQICLMIFLSLSSGFRAQFAELPTGLWHYNYYKHYMVAVAESQLC